MIHAGVYYPPGSLKARLCKAGAAATEEFCARHGIAFERCGKLLRALRGIDALDDMGKLLPLLVHEKGTGLS